MITRQSRRPLSTPGPKARHLGGRALVGVGDVVEIGPAGEIADARKVAKES